MERKTERKKKAFTSNTSKWDLLPGCLWPCLIPVWSEPHSPDKVPTAKIQAMACCLRDWDNLLSLKRRGGKQRGKKRRKHNRSVSFLFKPQGSMEYCRLGVEVHFFQKGTKHQNHSPSIWERGQRQVKCKMGHKMGRDQQRLSAQSRWGPWRSYRETSRLLYFSSTHCILLSGTEPPWVPYTDNFSENPLVPRLLQMNAYIHRHAINYIYIYNLYTFLYYIIYITYAINYILYKL